MTDLIGRVLGNGKYRIDRHLGGGGQGDVYKGTHLSLDAPIAIKVLSSLRGQDRAAQLRFEREAKRAARLSHHHIVRVQDFGYEDGIYYIVSEYIEGADLKSHLAQRKGPMPLDKALPILAQMADALHYAHEEGMVHRDVKPSNILLQRSTGRAVLCDFGLARMTEGEDLDATGTVVRLPGTPAYMSPEQCLGMDADRRTDLYSLAMVAYEMLCGRHPLREEHDTTKSIFLKQMHQMPMAPRKLNPQITPTMDRVLAKGLAKDRENRYATVAEFARELEAARHARPVRLPSVWPPPVPRWALWGAGGTLTICLMVLLVWPLVRPDGGGPTVTPSPVVVAKAERTVEPTPTATASPKPEPTDTPVAPVLVVQASTSVHTEVKGTPLVETATPTPTWTLVPPTSTLTPTLTETATPTSTSSLTPTFTPSPALSRYAGAPVLLRPVDTADRQDTQRDLNVEFKWNFDGTLRSGDQYELYVEQTDPQAMALAPKRTGDTSVTYLLPTEGRYEWYVAIVRQMTDGRWEAMSERSHRGSFWVAREQPSSPTSPPPTSPPPTPIPPTPIPPTPEPSYW